MTNEVHIPDNVPATPPTNTELLGDGLKLLSDALGHFMEIKNCPHGAAVSAIAHGLLLMGEMLYETYQQK